MVDCLLTKKRFHADQIEPQSGTVYQYTGASGVSGKSSNNVYAVLQDDAAKARKIAKAYYETLGLKEPELLGETTKTVTNSTAFNPENGGLLTVPRPFNLMFRTFVGPVQDDSGLAYLRPETAQAIFVQFLNVQAVARQRVPFGIAQIGKAFRNEINPRNFTFRSREFEQMEIEFFIKPDEVVRQQFPKTTMDNKASWGWKEWHTYWVDQRMRWYESIGLPETKLHRYLYRKEELAHYAKACVDVYFDFPFGSQELEGIAARGDFDLSQHQKHSGKSLEYFDDETKMHYIPHVVEPSAGVDRIALALLCNAYAEEEVPAGNGKNETRVVMKFAPRIAPVKVAVFPLLRNKPELVAKAASIYQTLHRELVCEWDDSGNVGKRYRRQDEIGTPFCITVDFDTLGEKGIALKDTVTVRDRDTMKQDRVAIAELLPWLKSRI
jgi:glycyl-tRNA synthetase